MKMKKVSLLHGDITTLPVDALVNSANKSLLGGGGLDYVIHKKAGVLMKNACIELNKAKGGCKTALLHKPSIKSLFSNIISK